MQKFHQLKNYKLCPFAFNSDEEPICVTDECMLWDEQFKSCSLKVLANILSKIQKEKEEMEKPN